MGRTAHVIAASLLLAGIAFGAAPSSAQSAETPPPVARVLDIEGPRLMTDRLTGVRWFQAFPGMRSRLQERLRTDETTYALMEFRIGGRAGISPGTEVEVLSQRDLRVVGNILRVKSGAFWASVDDQEQRLQIQTSGGVIGIEGTELLVKVDPESEVTEVLLFEGKARIRDNEGNEFELFPGDYAEFGGGASGCVLSYPPSALRTVVVERFPTFSSFLSSRGVTTIPLGADPTLRRSHLEPSRTFERLLGQLEAVEVVRDLEQVTLGSQSTAEGGDWVTGLSPAQETLAGERLAFRWDAVPGADSYLFLLSEGSDFEEFVFVSQPGTNRFEMPAGAPSLEAGRYHYRVIPVAETGEPIGRASESWFETEGWRSKGLGPVEEAPPVAAP